MTPDFVKSGRRTRRVQQSEVARRAGVSVSTVSRVLNNKTAGFISEEIKQRVLTVVQAINQENNLYGNSVGLNHIALCVTNISTDPSLDPFHANVLKGVEGECNRQNIQLSYTRIGSEKEEASFILDKIKQNKIDGILLLAIDDQRMLRHLLEARLPTILLNDNPHDLPIDTYLPNNWLGGKLAVNYLLAQGHRRILHITCPDRWTIRTRQAAYQNALEDNGIAYDPALVLHVSLGPETVYQALKAFIAQKTAEFSAIFCANDSAAIGALRALRESGLRVPDDVSLIGFDDIEVAAFLEPPLTTVRIESVELGARAVLGLLERAASPHQSPVWLEFTPSLVVRQSVQPYPV